MAIVKMKRLTLLAMKADKDEIYNALAKCQAVQLKRSAVSQPVETSAALETQIAKVNRAEEAIHYLSEQADLFNAENKHNKGVAKAQVPKNSFARPKTEINFDYFLSFGQNAMRIEGDLDKVFALRSRMAELEAEKAQNHAEYNRLALYKDLPHPTTWYKDTEHAVVQLSQLPASEFANLTTLARQYQTVDLEKICADSATQVLAVVVHKSERDFLEKAAAYGLVKCGLNCDVLPMVLLQNIQSKLQQAEKEISQVKADLVQFAGNVPEWKIYVDYVNLRVKKLLADCDLQNTSETFVLEGYCPAEDEEKVQNAITAVGDCLIVHFDEIAEDEFAPTLCRNNKVVEPFEMVTNMYTSPDYHEIDPNPVMSVFYFLIFGFMVADMGYGLVLCLLGLFATFAIKQKTGLKTMLQMFGICGISAIAVGALFGSFFSYTLFDGVIPDPSKYPMVMMILSIILGLVHIAAGIGCKMAVKIKHKETLSAWLSDFPWILVFAGLVVAIWNMALGMAAYEPYNVMILPKVVTQIGLYVCLGSLAVALICAGIGTKGIKGKVMKSCGSAYGIINYFSDAMSYIRVFGLMLSSALIGSVVNQLGQMVMGNGGLGYVMCALVLVVAHLFNLAMGVLSVYIHNGRLQYVEFFGKFYTGEGQLFVPFGSDTQYTLIKG